MSIYELKLPDLAEGTTEGEIAAWHVSVGESIEEDQPLVGVMTDKAIIDIPSPVTGTVASLHAAVGDKVPVGSVLMVLYSRDVLPEEVPQGSEPSRVAAVEARAASDKPASSSTLADPTPIAEQSASAEAPYLARPTASPCVRRRARDAALSLAQVRGSGPAGRVLHSDIDAALTHGLDSPPPVSAKPAPSTGASAVEEIRIVGMRRKIAERMVQSKRTIPHFSYVEEVDVTKLEELRSHLNADRSEQQAKLTPLPFIMRAMARALPDFPDINATYDSETSVLRRHSAIHIGAATQTSAGLLVPVVRHVQHRSLWGCATELIRVTSAARAGTATRNELAGSTITLTSLGPLGGIAATPIINFPEVAIIGPNRIVERPVVRAGQIVVRKMMNLSSSFDHRLIDGYVAAEFIARIKILLEVPDSLILDHA